MTALPSLSRTAVAPPLAFTPEIEALIAADAPVALGVSGGKDGAAAAYAVADHLDAARHRGPRVLIHAHLGVVEWDDSLPSCQRLADALGMELIVARRPAGGLLERWQTRWANNVARYADLSCVRLILPWSTPGMRFCTSELKEAPIAATLAARFPGRCIVSASGIRREESAQRAKVPTAAPSKRLLRVSTGTSGWNWHPVADWTLPEVWGYLAARGWAGHEAYHVWGVSRCSCRFCIMSKRADLAAAAACPAAAPLYRHLVTLECDSTFAFQGGRGKAARWLGDVAPHLLCSTLRDRLALAKAAAAVRETAETRIPKGLLYAKGWPTCIPTPDEATLLSEVRSQVATAVGIAVHHAAPDDVRARIEALYHQARRKEAARR